MRDKDFFKPDYLFEVSWEVCNKVGGIHTVVSSKVPFIEEKLRENYILIGPDVWKETTQNPEFIEDKSLLRLWREKAETQGLHFRTGRWNILGSPLVVLVDFTPYFSIKDKIFTDLWLSYKVDSISGQWDYTEPALFGYAAAKVIESYYDYYITAQDQIIAHFHEWMTGAGVLYLKEFVPQIGTIFTTHATVLGRAISGHGLPLYKDLDSIDADSMARRLNVYSKFSLEKTASHECDVFTTVSQLVSRECKHFLKREPDLITHNGFNPGFNPESELFEERRMLSRKRILEVASANVAADLPEDSFLVLTSGRYEFRNKGIDVFIESLGKLNKAGSEVSRHIVAIIALPAGQAGPRRELIERMKTRNYTSATIKASTHTLFDKESDIVINSLREKGLHNQPGDKVTVVFVPCYLDGKDGVFNLNYYELLPGFDATVFPSYYEPWGYTPLESIAFKVPSITTSLAGFGLFVRDNVADYDDAVTIIERNDENYQEVVDQITKKIISFQEFESEKVEKIKQKAVAIALKARWEIFIQSYFESFNIALHEVDKRRHLFRGKQYVDLHPAPASVSPKKVEWKKILIKPAVPQSLEPLHVLAQNLWWSWNIDAIALFESIDPMKWNELQHNPLALIESLTYNHIKLLSESKEFIANLEKVYGRFCEYMKAAENKPEKIIAYFSMEYGIHDTLKIYSGGLGVLAGDYLKEASDSNQNLIAIGLLYRYGYFQQNLSLLGDQIANQVPQKFTQMPILPVRDKNGNWVTIVLVLPGRNMYAKVWKADVGRIPLYLLDTDIPENNDYDKVVTHQLYGGDWENRFKQELLLGVGGKRMLDALGLRPDIYHLNEGHAAFTGLERLRHYMQNEKLNFRQSMELVRATTLFTTHTPVPAGHDAFSEDLLRTYIPHYAERINISWEEFMDLGRWNAGNTSEKFSMSVLAARLSQEMNGVSKIHSRVTREMFAPLYPGYFPEELYIGYVTNGVHYPTWAAAPWQELYKNTFGEKFLADQSNSEYWQKIYNIPDSVIWEIRNTLRSELINYLKKRILVDLKRRQETPKTIARILDSMRPDILTIGFARRFATYKRAHLLFNDLDRLKALVNNPQKPVQLIFAGKAHPDDKAGQELIKRIVQVSKSPDFLGKITFVENYDMELAAKLVQGVDLWLNTPTRPLEASGTSGEKAVMNGVMNLSVLDGWYAEGYQPGAGWALPEERTYTNQDLQDELDSLSIYNILEHEIIPSFYNRSDQNLPVEWIKSVKNTIAGIAPHFTMKRMLNDYISQYYIKLIERSVKLKADNFALVREIAGWKRRIILEWDNIEVVSVVLPDSTNQPLNVGDVFRAEVTIGIGALAIENVGVEIIFGQKENDEVKKILFSKELALKSIEGRQATFTLEFTSEKSGVYDYVFRIFPKNDLLPHWQDLHLIKWI